MVCDQRFVLGKTASMLPQFILLYTEVRIYSNLEHGGKGRKNKVHEQVFFLALMAKRFKLKISNYM